MPTRHEHALWSKSYRIATNCTRWRFHFTAILLAVLSFDLNYWQLGYSVRFCPLLSCACFRFLFTYTSNHLKEVDLVAITRSRGKVTIIIRHKHIWGEALKHLMHTKELMPREEVLKPSHQIAQHHFNVLFMMLIVIPDTVWTASSTIPSNEKVTRLNRVFSLWHLESGWKEWLSTTWAMMIWECSTQVCGSLPCGCSIPNNLTQRHLYNLHILSIADPNCGGSGSRTPT